MRKHRGLKRYYKNLKTQIDLDKSTGLNFSDPDKSWFDLWHVHFDNYGYGDKSFKKREPHLDKLFRHFDILSNKAKILNREYQIWITILDYESYDDALFLHTANPNQDNFPYKISGLSEKSNFTNSKLVEYLKKYPTYKMMYGVADENYCVIYKDNIGVPLT
jgi:hypothetical protein